jgi:hypothetical protein
MVTMGGHTCQTRTIMMLLNAGDLVVAANYIGVYRIQEFSEHGVIAKIQPYNIDSQTVTGDPISVQVTILRPFNLRKGAEKSA